MKDFEVITRSDDSREKASQMGAFTASSERASPGFHAEVRSSSKEAVENCYLFSIETLQIVSAQGCWIRTRHHR